MTISRMGGGMGLTHALRSSGESAPASGVPALLSSSTGSVDEYSALAFPMEFDEAVSLTKIGGADSALFDFTAASGTTVNLTMGPQRYGVPADANLDNSHIVSVRAESLASPGQYVDIGFVIDVVDVEVTGVVVDTTAGSNFVDDFVAVTDTVVAITAAQIVCEDVATSTGQLADPVIIYVATESGATYTHAWDNWTFNVKGTIDRHFDLANSPGLIVGLIDNDGYRFGYQIRSSPSTAAGIFMWGAGQGTDLLAPDNEGYAFTAPCAFDLTVTRNGQSFSVAGTVDGAAQSPLALSLSYNHILTNGSYKVPNSGQKPAIIYQKGGFTVKEAIFTRGLPEADMVVCGDSVPTGIGVATYADCLMARLRAYYSTSVIGLFGRPGATTAILLAMMPEVLANRGQRLLIQIGANDINNGVPAATTQANLLAIEALALSYGADVAFANILPQDDSAVATMNSWMVANLSVPVIDLYTHLKGTGQELAAAYDIGDRLHPNGAGDGVMFDRYKIFIDANSWLETP